MSRSFKASLFPARPPLYYNRAEGRSRAASRDCLREVALLSFDSNDRACLTRVWKNAYLIDTNVISRMIGINFVLEALELWIDEVKGSVDFEEFLMGGTIPAELLSA